MKAASEFIALVGDVVHIGYACECGRWWRRFDELDLDCSAHSMQLHLPFPIFHSPRVTRELQGGAE